MVIFVMSKNIYKKQCVLSTDKTSTSMMKPKSVTK